MGQKALPEVGREIVILKRTSALWDSSAGRSPSDVIYPLRGIVTDSSERNGGCISVAGYGFASCNIEWEYILETYQIY